jgi:spermidine synthase
MSAFGRRAPARVESTVAGACVEASSVESRLLLVSVFLVAAAGLVYELIAGTLATYLLGSSVTVFSLVIGIFLAAMGGGAWLAQFVRNGLARWFVAAELALALLGGLSALLLFGAYVVSADGFPVVLGLICIGIGALVGLEIPILMRIVESGSSVRLAVSRVLAVDYVGALLGSVLFPLVLLPHLGLVRTAALLGLINLAVAFVAMHIMGSSIQGNRQLKTVGLGIGLVLMAVFGTAGMTTTWAEDQLYQDPIVLAATTPYQRVVVTRWRSDTRLYLNGHLQFSTVDEHRYHEALVHPAMSAVDVPARVLILGGGDGLAVRTVLQHPSVERIDLVDLDPELIALFQAGGQLEHVNQGALSDPRVVVHAMDALRFVETTDQTWDVILMDLPDPNDDTLARLYAQSTYRLVSSRLSPSGILVTQATSPYFAPDAFWCIVKTLESVASADQIVRPYHLSVPSFGEWGFVMVGPASQSVDHLRPGIETEFLDDETLTSMFHFPRDLARRDVEVNRLTTARVSRYYRDGWSTFN